MTRQGLRSLLFELAGLGILVHEMMIATEPRVALLAMAAGMMGLPIVSPLDPATRRAATKKRKKAVKRRVRR